MFPDDDSESEDSDGDGIGDNSDICPGDIENDEDGDGVCESDEVSVVKILLRVTIIKMQQ